MDFQGDEENTVQKIDDHIFQMWEQVIVPYMEDVGNNMILDQLDAYDARPFWRFFYEKNPVYIHLDENENENKRDSDDVQHVNSEDSLNNRNFNQRTHDFETIDLDN